MEPETSAGLEKKNWELRKNLKNRKIFIIPEWKMK
jgi:hypothetical protein